MAGLNPQWDAGYSAGFADGAQDNEQLLGDMLAALKRALFVLESPTMPSYVNGAGAVDEVRAAIAKAEGQS